ncbi:MAG: sulfate ABC transporter permease subunit CysT [Terracidiphilus sp.]
MTRRPSVKAPGLLKRYSPLPGFRLSLGFTWLYLVVIVLLPLAAILSRSLRGGSAHFLHAILTPRVESACRVTLESAVLASLVAAVFGSLVAWVLARYDFPGRRIVDALIDLPFALPTAVAGISLTSLYSENGWIGQYLEPRGVHVAFTQLGISLAMSFVGLPFVVRSVQPVLEEIDSAMEEAASSLGASAWQVFARVLAPVCLPALLTGTVLAFARAAGEYGSVVFIAGNMPMKTEIASLLVVTKLEEYDYTGASAIAVAMLALSFAVMLGLNLMQWRLQRREGSRI